MTTATAAKERPILFSGSMVRAILDGRKTQTRRVVKQQIFPPADIRVIECHDLEDGGYGFSTEDEDIRCPYGNPGDSLWVRETWRPKIAHHCAMNSCDCADISVSYAADGLHAYFPERDIPDKWMMPKAAKRGNVSCMFMPRWACRITLRITSVRVERLKEISEEDAEAEGVSMGDDLLVCSEGCGHRDFEGDHLSRWEKDDDWGEICPKCGCYLWHHPIDEQYRQSFRNLWDEINGKGSWADNPWVWVVSFERIP